MIIFHTLGENRFKSQDCRELVRNYFASAVTLDASDCGDTLLFLSESSDTFFQIDSQIVVWGNTCLKSPKVDHVSVLLDVITQIDLYKHVQNFVFLTHTNMHALCAKRKTNQPNKKTSKLFITIYRIIYMVKCSSIYNIYTFLCRNEHQAGHYILQD